MSHISDTKDVINIFAKIEKNIFIKYKKKNGI